MKFVKSLGYVMRDDDLRNMHLWMSDPFTYKIFQLFVEQAYSVPQVAKMCDIDERVICALIDGIRLHYKISLGKQIKNRMNCLLISHKFKKGEFL